MQLFRRSRRFSRDNHNSSDIRPSEPLHNSIPRSSTNQLLAPEFLRSFSQETLASHSIVQDLNYYLPESYTDRLTRTTSSGSGLTIISKAETVVDLVLGHSFGEFNQIRTLPVVSQIFQKGILLFPSDESLSLYKSQNRNVDIDLRKRGLGMPLLQVITPMLSSFKRNGPLIVIHRFKSIPTNYVNHSDANTVENPKYEYCKVYLKFFRDSTAKYILSFMPNGDPNDHANNFQIIMVTNPKVPYIDTIYRKTRLRWIGTTNVTSSFGSGFFKMLILNDESPSLTDFLNPDDIDSRPDPMVLDSVSRDTSSITSSFPPIARFSDKDSTTVPTKRLNKHGDVRLIEVFNNMLNRDSIEDVPDCSIVLTCMSLVLRDQEQRKNHGNARCIDASMSASVYY